jgi:DNA-binding beta-propeller fold protein YncE
VSGGQELYSDGTHLWAATGDDVLEIDESSGSIVRTLANGYPFGNIQSLIATGWHLWVMSYSADPFGQTYGSLVEIDIATGSVLRVRGGEALDLGDEVGIASDGAHLWVADYYAPSEELSQATGARIRSLPGAWAVTYADGHVWFSSGADSDPELTEVNPSTGKTIRVVTAEAGSFTWPYAIEADGSHLWVPDFYGNSVTELDESDGSVVRVFQDPAYGFNGPTPITAASGHLWVVDDTTMAELTEPGGALVRTVELPELTSGAPGTVAADGTHVWLAGLDDSVAEFDESTGALLRVISNPADHLDGPLGVASSGGELWVANAGNNTVTELDESDGSLVRVLSGEAYGFDHPDGIAADGTHVWVVNEAGASVSELLQSTGAAVQVLAAPRDDISYPDGVVADGTHVWVLNESSSTTTGSVTELTTSGALVRVLAGPAFRFDDPQAILADGAGHVWVISVDGTLTEIAASSGAPVRTEPDGIEQYGGPGPHSMVAAGGYLWVADSTDNAVAQLSLASGVVVHVLAAS